MEFERAKQIGDEGERLVAAELERLAPEYGLSVLSDVLLQVDKTTAQLDHVVVDRFGVLIIESKVRRGALIRGNDVERRWTACYPGRSIPFQNPLVQNREHENAVRKALKHAGSPLDPDYVKSAVVIVGADLSALELDSLARARVVDIGDVEGLIRARHDFAPNAGSLTAEQVAALAGLLRGLNRAQDAAVAEQHAVARGGARSASTSAAAPVDWDAIARRPSPGRRTTPGSANLIARVLLVFMMGAALWFFTLGPGQQAVTDFLMSGFRHSSGAQPESPSGAAVPVVAENIPQAKATLREVAPDIYAEVADLDKPIVTHVPQGTTYTWKYVKASGATATVRSIALTLDASGQLVGVDMR